VNPEKADSTLSKSSRPTGPELRVNANNVLLRAFEQIDRYQHRARAPRLCITLSAIINEVKSEDAKVLLRRRTRMNRREIAALCCRIVALIVVAWALTYFAQMLLQLDLAITNSTSAVRPENLFWGVKLSGSMGCALLLFAMALGWKADAISRWMASDDPNPVTGPDLSADALMPVACAGVGLFAVSRTLPTFFRLAAVLVTGQMTAGEIWADNEWNVSIIADSLLLAWGLWLILGARGLMRVVSWARSAGKELKPANGDAGFLP
jgi:hypothetical protein